MELMEVLNNFWFFLVSMVFFFFRILNFEYDEEKSDGGGVEGLWV